MDNTYINKIDEELKKLAEKKTPAWHAFAGNVDINI